MKKTLFSLIFGSHPTAKALFDMLVTHQSISKEAAILKTIEEKRSKSANKLIDFKASFKASKNALSAHWDIA